MTRDEYAEKLRQMTARELDAEVAEKVMGFSKPIYVHPPELHHEVGGRIVVKGWYCQPDYKHGDVCEWHPIHYSENIAAAWEIIEKMCQKFFLTRLMMWDYTDEVCIVLAPRHGHGEEADELIIFADTAPRAICIAACLAVWQGQP